MMDGNRSATGQSSAHIVLLWGLDFFFVVFFVFLNKGEPFAAVKRREIVLLNPF